MKKQILFLCMASLIISCMGIDDGKSELKAFKRDLSYFETFVNNVEEEANLNKHTYVANDDYPIEIALYKDKRFYYNLPNYGEGYGQWRHVGGKIKLEARTRHFPMHIDMFATNEEGTEMAISFRDRFGPQVRTVQINNLRK